MAATVQAWRDSGALTGGHGTTRGSAEGGATLALNEAGTTQVAVPTAAGTNFSWPVWLYHDVTVASTTHITNRVAKLVSALPAGLHLWGKSVASGSYVQPAATAGTNSATTNGVAPAGYTEITTAGWQWDNTSVSTAATGQNGNYLVIAFGVDFLYTGGGGNVAAPALNLYYDEGP